MKVLVVAPPGSRRNPYARLLSGALQSNGCDVSLSIEGLFCGENADIVNLHWPEALFNWKQPVATELAALKALLAEVMQRSVLVATVHNHHPHGRDTREFKELYREVYAACSGYVHFGNASVEAFRASYPEFAHRAHTVIPHGTYDTFPLNVTRGEARRLLSIPADAFVIGSVGQLRSLRELRLLLWSRSCAGGAAYTVFAGRLPLSQRWPVTALSRVALGMVPRLRSHIGYVPDDDVACYVLACDVILIPRIDVNNSGGVALAFTFGRVAVGPEKGVVGEILSATGNPTFGSPDRSTLCDALERGRGLAYAGLGEGNQRFAAARWNWRLLGGAYRRFFEELVATGPRTTARLDGCATQGT